MKRRRRPRAAFLGLVVLLLYVFLLAPIAIVINILITLGMVILTERLVALESLPGDDPTAGSP